MVIRSISSQHSTPFTLLALIFLTIAIMASSASAQGRDATKPTVEPSAANPTHRGDDIMRTNPGWCPRTPGYWKTHVNSWPANHLSVGNHSYSQSALLSMLYYGGSDASSKLARHLVAAKFNVAAGSSSVINGTIAEADLFLANHPPGSHPTGSSRELALDIKDDLSSYNNNEGDNLCGDTYTPPPTGDHCVDRADRESNGHRGHAIWLPGIGQDFVFDLDPGRFLEAGDGTAHLTGVARRASDPSQAFQVDLVVSNYSSTPPPGSPKKELPSSAYSENGGPVNTSTWWYYEDFIGTLTGIESYAGAVVQLDRRGPAFQVGEGASGKNTRHGASAWMNYEVLSQGNNTSFPNSGHGDINIDLEKCTKLCVQEADVDLDYLSAATQTHVLLLEGIGGNFFFTDRTVLVEYENGSARLMGEVYKGTNPNKRFQVEAYLDGRTSTPPAGSPKLELPSVAYVDNGGPVDPSSWYYYTGLHGTFTGRGALEGAELSFTRLGPAFQVGQGASGKNILYGASGWLDYVTEQQPNSGSLPASGRGDFNLTKCPPEIATTPPMDGCAGAQVIEFLPGTCGAGPEPEAQRLDVSQATFIPEDTEGLNFLSLGFGGSVTLELSARVLNGDGPDLTLYETSFAGKGCDQSPERARVWGSQDGRGWTELGTVCQDGSIELGNLMYIHYLRIVDISDPGDFFAGVAADGYDLDGVLAYHCGR